MFTTIRAVIHYKTKMIFAEVAPEKVAFDSFGHFHSLPSNYLFIFSPTQKEFKVISRSAFKAMNISEKIG